MATLDISSALNSMVQANTPQAQMERNLGLAMFASKVSDVADVATEKLLRDAKEIKQLIQNDEIDEEIANLVIDARKSRLETSSRFYSNYFG